MVNKNITEYALNFKHGMSANTIHFMKHEKAITTMNSDNFCFIPDREAEDILKHDKEHSLSVQLLNPENYKALFFNSFDILFYTKSGSIRDSKIHTQAFIIHK